MRSFQLPSLRDAIFDLAFFAPRKYRIALKLIEGRDSHIGATAISSKYMGSRSHEDVVGLKVFILYPAIEDGDNSKVVSSIRKTTEFLYLRKSNLVVTESKRFAV